MKSPAAPKAVAVTVTTLVDELAVTPRFVLFRLIAAARLVASVVVLLEVIKFKPVFEPLPPPSVAPDQVKPDRISASVMLLPAAPGSVAVTVTTPDAEVALTPTELPLPA